jgi:hypothetical protein
MADTLASDLKGRVRAVLDRQLVSEAELRKLFEDGRACVLILSGLLESCERTLSRLAADPDSSLADAADAVRAANELRPDLDELHALLAALEERAREVRAAWLSAP